MGFSGTFASQGKQVTKSLTGACTNTFLGQISLVKLLNGLDMPSPWVVPCLGYPSLFVLCSTSAHVPLPITDGIWTSSKMITPSSGKPSSHSSIDVNVEHRTYIYTEHEFVEFDSCYIVQLFLFESKCMGT